MSFSFMPIKDTADTYQYVQAYMTKEEYLKKLGDVKLITPDKQLKEGAFPSIYLPSTTNENISIAEVAKKSNVVIFFYPGDKEGLNYPELAGCTPEACSFRDTIKELEKLNTQVFGISFQSSERQKSFYIAQHLNFPLLSDADRTLSQALGLPYWKSKKDELYPCRQTFLIGQGNVISKVFEKVEPKSHIDEVIKEVKNLVKVRGLTT